MSRRELIVIDLIAIGMIIIAIAIKVSREFPLSLGVPIPSEVQKTLGISQNFFDNSASSPNSNSSANSGPSANANQSKPQTPVYQSPVSAVAYLVGNVKTGKIYSEQNPNSVLPVASMSKLITAFAATDSYKADTLITITDAETNVASDTSRLTAGEKFMLQELLYPMLLNSSNVAAEAIASSSNRNEFLINMAGYATEVGMPHTHFADPSGISPQNRSTAADFFELAKYLYSSRPDILAITKTWRVETATTSLHNAHKFESIHPFVNDPNFLGGKTGHTPEAKDTMLTIMNIGGEPVAIIVLASNNRQKDTAYLIGEVAASLAKK